MTGVTLFLETSKSLLVKILTLTNGLGRELASKHGWCSGSMLVWDGRSDHVILVHSPVRTGNVWGFKPVPATCLSFRVHRSRQFPSDHLIGVFFQMTHVRVCSVKTIFNWFILYVLNVKSSSSNTCSVPVKKC